jgi:hypothetical protein
LKINISEYEPVSVRREPDGLLSLAVGIDSFLFQRHSDFGKENDVWKRSLESFGKYRTLCAHDD